MFQASAHATANRDHHKHIGDIGARLAEAAASAPDDTGDIVNLLLELRGSVRLHFTTEENVMEEIDYPCQIDHQMSHAFIVDELSAAVDEVIGQSEEWRRAVWPRLWSRLDAHMSTYDADLLGFMAGVPVATVPETAAHRPPASLRPPG